MTEVAFIVWWLAVYLFGHVCVCVRVRVCVFVCARALCVCVMFVDATCMWHCSFFSIFSRMWIQIPSYTDRIMLADILAVYVVFHCNSLKATAFFFSCVIMTGDNSPNEHLRFNFDYSPWSGRSAVSCCSLAPSSLSCPNSVCCRQQSFSFLSVIFLFHVLSNIARHDIKCCLSILT